MERKNKCKNVGFSVILWAVTAVVLFATPGYAQYVEVPAGQEWDIPGDAGPTIVVLWVSGTANILTGADVDYIDAYSGSHVNLYGGTVGYAISVYEGADVKVYGASFTVAGDPTVHYPGETLSINAVLTAYDPEEVPLFTGMISCSEGVYISLTNPGSPPPENEPPVADAGPDLTVFIMDIASTVIDGTATDPDEGDSLQYQWFEGEIAFTLPTDVGANGEAPLDLGTILPQYLDVGIHTLTLEVEDGTDIVPDDMVLKIIPQIDIKPGSYPNSLNINGHGVIPVAIMGSANLDVSDVDIQTLCFAGLELRVKGNGSPQCSIQDVSGDFITPEGAPDGYPDLVCQFVDNPDNWIPGDGTATLTGQLIDGTPFEWTDEIRVVQE